MNWLIWFSATLLLFHSIAALLRHCGYMHWHTTRSVQVIIYLSTALQPFVGSWPCFQFLDLFTQSVGLLGRGIGPSQGHYLHTEQHKHRINAHRHQCLKWIRTHDPSVRAGEDGSCLRPAQPLWSAVRVTIWLSMYGSTALYWALVAFSVS
jgi:hypothetical protein